MLPFALRLSETLHIINSCHWLCTLHVCTMYVGVGEETKWREKSHKPMYSTYCEKKYYRQMYAHWINGKCQLCIVDLMKCLSNVKVGILKINTCLVPHIRYFLYHYDWNMHISFAFFFLFGGWCSTWVWRFVLHSQQRAHKLKNLIRSICLYGCSMVDAKKTRMTCTYTRMWWWELCETRALWLR